MFTLGDAGMGRDSSCIRTPASFGENRAFEGMITVFDPISTLFVLFLYKKGIFCIFNNIKMIAVN